MYNNYNLVFDPLKNKSNQEKHAGISLAEAVNFDWAKAAYIVDARREYGELRIIGFGSIKDRLFVVVFVERENERRIISLRKANAREVKRYAQT